MTAFFDRIDHLFSLPLSENVPLFCLMLAVILIMPMITRRLHLPQVIGLILCGVVIGPHALNLVDNNGPISLFSTIGLLYIMFTAGLELDINQFKINKNRSLLFGLLTYLGPLVVIFPIAYWGYGFSGLQSFLIGSMFGTHTLIAYPAVSRLGVAKDPAVAVTVGGTILVDAGVLILLSVLLGIHGGDLSPEFWLNLALSLAAFSLIMFLVIPRIGTWFFTHFHQEKYLRFTFILLMVFLSGLVAELSGLEPIIGAFVAGLVLNRFIPQHSALMHDIEFVGNAIFIPFFLVSVGMLVNLGVILNGPATILTAIVLSIAAIAGKFLAAWCAQKGFHYSHHQRNVMFGLSTARVAATLAIALVAYQAGLVNEILLNASILLILVTSITGSLVTEKAAQSLAADQQASTNHASDSSHEHILVPIANPAHAYDIMAFADLIHAPQSSAPVSLLSVVPDNEHADAAIQTIRATLKKSIQDAGAATQMHITTAINPGISEGIAKAAREQLATILIMGWPKSGFSERMMGEKWKSIVHDINRMIFWVDLPIPLTQPKRIVLVTLPRAELEWGFEEWLNKILFLATQSSLPIRHFGTSETRKAIDGFLKSTRQTANIETSPYEPFHPDAENTVTPDEWIIFVSARPSTLSRHPHCANAPAYLSKKYPKSNKMLIYPTQSPEAFAENDEFEHIA